jgi:DNA-binding Lrp family transcriptional regulator
MTLDALDRRIVEATQGGLPLVPRPFAAVAGTVGATEEAVLARFGALQAQGAVRRIAAAPNHYALGMVANAMTVWDVEDARVDALGARVGALPFVTHSYRRPRARPVWPYNLFAMVHGRSAAEVEALRAAIAALLGDACRASDALYSTRILKKTGLRLGRPEG